MLTLEQNLELTLDNYLTDIRVHRIMTKQRTGELTEGECAPARERALRVGKVGYEDVENGVELYEQYVKAFDERVARIHDNKEDEFTDEVYQSLKASREERMRKNDYL